jgi:multiple sugar transport system substrate-binding protein
MRRLLSGSVAIIASLALSVPVLAQGDAALEPATLKVWIPFGGAEAPFVEEVIADFGAMHPELTIEVSTDVGDQAILDGLRTGDSPDVAVSWESSNMGLFCSPGGFEDLGPWIERDGVDLANIAEASLSYTQHDGVRCALPMLADAYGLYYNEALLEEAGLDGPPATVSELADYAKKLTTRNDDGSLAVVGFNPLFGFYENTPSRYATMFGAEWVDEAGASVLGTDPAWADALTWQKELVDWYGYDELVAWQTGAGDEWTASNAFQTGKVAMNLDGEWRTAFIGREAPDLAYGTAPVPVADDKPELYGSGYINGTIVGIPSNAANKEQAWALIKYLTTDDAALAKLSNGLRNVPSTKSSAEHPDLVRDEDFETFLGIFAHPESSTTPVTAVGRAYEDLVNSFVTQWQAGEVSDLAAGLTDLDQQIDDQLAQAGG